MSPTNTFTITAAPGTDIWRKPPTTNVFNAPTALPPSTSTRTRGLLSTFLSARLSFNFTPTQQYDQGGLLLSFRRANSDSESQDTNTNSNTTTSPPEKWIKCGIELYNGRPRLSTVACDAWADWSVADFPDVQNGAQATGWTTVLVEKDKDGNGTGVWVYRVIEETGEKVPLREICWVFAGDGEGWEVEVSAMAARPGKEKEDGLEVEFTGLEVRWRE